MGGQQGNTTTLLCPKYVRNIETYLKISNSIEIQERSKTSPLQSNSIIFCILVFSAASYTRSRDEPSARNSPVPYIHGRVLRKWTPGLTKTGAPAAVEVRGSSPLSPTIRFFGNIHLADLIRRWLWAYIYRPISFAVVLLGAPQPSTVRSRSVFHGNSEWG